MQMQTGGERAGLGLGGQPALQAGLWRQDRESAGGGGAADQAQVTQRHLAEVDVPFETTQRLKLLSCLL